jgi:hypothetical protein
MAVDFAQVVLDVVDRVVCSVCENCGTVVAGGEGSNAANYIFLSISYFR